MENQINNSNHKSLKLILNIYLVLTVIGLIYVWYLNDYSLVYLFDNIGYGLGAIFGAFFLKSFCGVIIDIFLTLKDINSKLTKNGTNV